MIRLIGAKKVLDIGTYTGVSALNSALAVPKSGEIFTFEKSKKSAKIARNNIKDFDIDHKVKFRVGEATHEIEKLLNEGQEETFDFSYIDADKANYPNYFDLSLKLLRPGGLIATDNTLFKGLVETDDKTGKRIDLANKYFTKNRLTEVLLLNIGDGYTLAMKNSD